MIGNSCFLINLHPSSQDWVIFRDDEKGRVLGSGSLKILGLAKLKNMLLVEGLTVNLISVSQLCDEDLLLQFIKDKCIIYIIKITVASWKGKGPQLTTIY